ncbi:MAG: hypothetical protein ACOC3V_02230 [bacterium]
MNRNDPKLILKVDLLNNNSVKFHLLSMNDYFITKKTNKKTFFSEDMFMINSAGFFSIFKSRSLYLPINFKETKNKSISLVFNSEKIRYDFLKDLNRALLEWSISIYWYGFNKPSNTKIIYNNNTWILY